MNFVDLRKKVIEKEFGSMNRQQLEAVTQTEGAVLVLAGAGSGKTTVLVNRIANLIKYGHAYNSDFVPEYTQEDIDKAKAFLSGETESIYNPVFSVSAAKVWEILAITFTNKAAGELKDRICAKIGEDSEDVWAGTFHSVCGKILRINAEYIGYDSHFTIYDTDDQKRLMKDIMKQRDVNEKMFPVKSVLSAISSAKDSLVTPEEYQASAGADLRQKTIAQLYCDYQAGLKKANAMDFDDMIVNTVKLFRENPDVLEKYSRRFRFVMVDEYQDTNRAQYELVRLLSSYHKNLCVVGDDDQSIYKFRGATIENILNFEDDYTGAKIIRLEQNYRSTGNILNAANSVISNNRARKGKNLWTDAGDGELIEVYTAADERREARFVADRILENVRLGDSFSSHAILYRMNAQSANFENAFVRSGISYRVIGGTRFYDRKEIKDVLAYLNVINNKKDNVRLKRIVNEPRRGIGDTTVKKASGIAESINTDLFSVFSSASDFPAISKAASRLSDFCGIINELELLSRSQSVSEILVATLEKTGYRDALACELTEESKDRLANIDELLNSVKQYEMENDEPTLAGFLEEVALVSDIDSMNETDDKVTLMTIHSAKGLEFKNVFLVGFEEGIFPGSQCIYGGADEIEEERRLCYVAITRAKRRLFITNTLTRMLYGSTGRNMPSRFLKEIPEEYCAFKAEVSQYGRDGFFDGFGGRSSYSYGCDFGERDAGHVFGAGVPYKRESIFNQQNTATPKVAEDNNTIYNTGQTVLHKTFGKGQILSVMPMGNDTLIEIEFETAGKKKLMAAYAKLKVL